MNVNLYLSQCENFSNHFVAGDFNINVLEDQLSDDAINSNMNY